VPFDDPNNYKLISKIASSNVRFPSNLDPTVKDFIQKLLVKNPKQRLNYEQIKAHQFWKGFDFEKVLLKQYHPDFVPANIRSSSIEDICKLYFDSELKESKQNKGDQFCYPTLEHFSFFAFDD
jgi:serine/threonine protein kinase